MTKIAFIGLGNMGSGMCANLCKAGHEVRAFDLNAEVVKAAEGHGAIAAATIADAVKDSEIVVTMLPAGKHVLSVYFGEDGVASHTATGTLFLDCSTIAVEDAREAASKAEAAGFLMADAPVSGGTAAADAGTLTFMVGGPDEAYAKAKPILDVMGKNIFHAGGSGNGQAAKIANNMLLGISMIGTCEAFNLAEKLGLDAQTFFDISSTASGQCWSMTSYCPAPGPVPTSPANRDYQPGFAVAMMLKDLHLAASAARAAGAEVTLGEMAEKIYQDLDTRGHGGLDFSGVMKDLQQRLD
ncbi:MAG TPA: 3-hydroxyisobutyrate dehydrogenase [Hyphomonas sp.]|jgi:3-hydroxyisobutyrate dehydrogenase|uniref:3-hydroxyisobutyrate dehydrogenase n=2 Tax=Hyphomonas TaxID=85 RepID=UPI000C616286|nr:MULTISPECIES: 3-hydroxyisobutyrate dehydrogenase [unclassified Hyphomonas]MAL43205.1 3-hydroxyisobutyrate dehydrogenase [Hyphomonas sp.]MAX84637.1 3-hydroxyisobutyrate dehydrogenase [Hyphomonas sp.]HBJ40620.1 3-hydroxyisobutyrate dehydrogenase [Hyphomonas sp.]HBT34670.1 3-hydroxyisobutyrate dehydrogenase [Hyphomonas sp.]HBU32652.1 3-hydroxyisobutyrate dehydrogenase [Hyphomonas sp.]|tara:strand:- start:2117 stop:3010 length:894 start_codon:yes stop_codon:yes gene_type:complete